MGSSSRPILGERGPVGRGHYLDDARMTLGGGDVEEDHATPRDAAHREDRVEHTRRVVVGRVAGLPVTFMIPSRRVIG